MTPVVRNHDRGAWNRQVEAGNEWTVPITPEEAYERGEFVIANRLPHSDLESLPAYEIALRRGEGFLLEFSHSLQAQIGGQLAAGFVLIGLYEDYYPPAYGLLSRYMQTFLATRARKRHSRCTMIRRHPIV